MDSEYHILDSTGKLCGLLL